MSTKSQWHRYHEQRSGPGKAKGPAKARRDDPVDTSAPGVSATSRKAGAGRSARRNRSARAARKASYALEDSAGASSRKSTRKSGNRVKASHLLRRVKTRARQRRA